MLCIGWNTTAIKLRITINEEYIWSLVAFMFGLNISVDSDTVYQLSNCSVTLWLGRNQFTVTWISGDNEH